MMFMIFDVLFFFFFGVCDMDVLWKTIYSLNIHVMIYSVKKFQSYLKLLKIKNKNIEVNIKIATTIFIISL